MSLYFIKPVVWNSQGYLRPSGEKFVSGYPAETGFGHEEWNNSPRLTFTDGGELKHAFHTEGFGNQLLDKAPADIFVFMIASYRGKQYLVAVAGRSTSLFENRHRKERERLFGLIADKSQFPKDAWSLDGVQKAHSNSYSKLLARWHKEQHWFVSWICPADHYLGLAAPLELDATAITGRRRLVGMYGAYQEIGRAQALRIIDCVPASENQRVLTNLKNAISHSDSDVATDIEELIVRTKTRPTTRRALIDARLGQGKFRQQLEDQWSEACAVTGCSVRELLRASHIKPWKSSSDKERLDSKNGILLTVHLDALFDSGLITFDETGAIISSSKLTDNGNPRLDLSGTIVAPLSDQTKTYLRHHQEYVFRG
jgi:HNH endonuclease